MAQRKWTAAQKNAIEAASGTVLVSAAAGSGKTSVLVERIVRKLTDPENPVPPESLLVVTFTNAAAAEMRGRIALRIADIISKKRSTENTFLLAKLSEMQVCTMDSFCMALVKENFHFLGIEADFRILEKGESSDIKRKAVTRVLERRFNEAPETFLPLAQMFDSGKDDSSLMENIIKLSDFSMSEPSAEKWLNSVAEEYGCADAADGVWGRKVLEELRDDIAYCCYLSDGALKDIEEDAELSERYYALFFHENRLLRTLSQEISDEKWDAVREKLAHTVSLIKASSLPRLPGGYSENPSKLSAQTKRNAIKAVLDKALEYMNISEADHAEDTAVIKGIAAELVETVKEYNAVLKEMKNEISAYDFSDISHFALSLLSDSEAEDGKTPLARELTEKFSEILIDEYQDTNRAQDELFRLVSKDGKNMFFVGDVKQSIYRFRLASPEIFIEKCAEFPYYDGIAEKSKIILGENFRSRKGILDGVNYVFSEIMTPQCGEINYNEDERLNFPSSAEPDISKDVSFTLIEAGEEDALLSQARYIARVIKDSIDRGEEVSDSGQKRKAVYSDFCILIRSPDGIASLYSNELKRLGIPVSSEASQGFFETPEIKTVMSYLHVIDNPGLDTDMLAVMMSPLFGFSADDAAAIRIEYGRRTSLYGCVLKAAGDGNEKCRQLVKKLDRFKKLSACVSADDIIREIYADTAYVYAAGAMTDGDARRKNLRLFLEKAEKASQTYTTLSSFIRYMDMLRENGADSGASAGGNGVRIMSMHKSKGLEFPFVFIAASEKRFNKQDLYKNLVINHTLGFGMKRREPEKIKNYDTLSSLAVKGKNAADLISEEIRIYYVAMTRAKQKLFMPIVIKNAEKHLREREYLISNLETIPSYLIKHASSASEWLLYAFMRHPDGGSIRFAGRSEKMPEGTVEISYISSFAENGSSVSISEPALPDESLVEEIRKRSSFVYKYAPVASSLASHTASSLDDEYFDPAGFGKSVPAFMFAKQMSPADIGTYTHRFLQYCDFSVCKTDISKEVKRLVDECRLNEKQAGAVDTDSIKAFVNSDIMRRCEKADAVYREKQFSMAKSVCEVDERIPEEFAEEKTVVIGKIDLVFTEGDTAVIVDYKTDNIDNINVLPARYRKQMELYAEALTKAMGLKVKECILYSLKLKQSISLML